MHNTRNTDRISAAAAVVTETKLKLFCALYHVYVSRLSLQQQQQQQRRQQQQ
jgi:hypothetical protein